MPNPPSVSRASRPPTASPLGRVRKLDWHVPEAPRATVRPGGAGRELERFDEALLWARRHLERLKAETETLLGSVEARIFDPQILMLEDPEVVEGTRRYISEHRVTAARAFEWRMLELRELWARTSHSMVLDRLNDLQDLKLRVLNRLLGLGSPWETNDEPDAVIVARELTPSFVAGLDPGTVKGLATDGGVARLPLGDPRAVNGGPRGRGAGGRLCTGARWPRDHRGRAHGTRRGRPGGLGGGAVRTAPVQDHGLDASGRVGRERTGHHARQRRRDPSGESGSARGSAARAGARRGGESGSSAPNSWWSGAARSRTRRSSIWPTGQLRRPFPRRPCSSGCSISGATSFRSFCTCQPRTTPSWGDGGVRVCRGRARTLPRAASRDSAGRRSRRCPHHGAAGKQHPGNGGVPGAAGGGRRAAGTSWGAFQGRCQGRRHDRDSGRGAGGAGVGRPAPTFSRSAPMTSSSTPWPSTVPTPASRTSSIPSTPPCRG